MRSGFIYKDDSQIEPSKQCDVLVYDSTVRQPYYQIDEFVVVSPKTAKQIVEVKSTINDKEFKKIREMAAYANNVSKPLLGFVYGGWKFQTFCKKVKDFADSIASLPAALVVHEHNYLAVRNEYQGEEVYFLIDFSKSSPLAGYGHRLLPEHLRTAAVPATCPEW